MTKITDVSLSEIREKIEAIDSDTILLCVDHQVWGVYGKKLNLESIKNKKIHMWKAANGEQSKSLEEYGRCVEHFISKGVHRNVHLVAVGGGAVSDSAGFVAATILRGISWSVIPTTLLSMIDASIGGKVAINSDNYKNLIGAFHLPDQVYLCHEFLSSLPESEMISGKGELSKYAFLNQKIFDLVYKSAPLGQIIEKCADYKNQIVEEDFKEGHKRKILNLGHTFGHGIEKIYGVSHGEAVFWGMALIFKLDNRDDLFEHLKMIKNKLEISLSEPPWLNKVFPVDELMDYLSKDKKVVGIDSIDLVIVKEVGKIEIVNTSIEYLGKKLVEKKDELRKFTI